jgi:hypothetical protein
MFKNQLLYKADRLFDGLGVVGKGKKGGLGDRDFWFLSWDYVQKTGNIIFFNLSKNGGDYNAIFFNARRIMD